jgi:hypothetical protein
MVIVNAISHVYLFDHTVLPISTDLIISKIVPQRDGASSVVRRLLCSDVLSAGLDPEASCPRRRILMLNQTILQPCQSPALLRSITVP